MFIESNFFSECLSADDIVRAKQVIKMSSHCVRMKIESEKERECMCVCS